MCIRDRIFLSLSAQLRLIRSIRGLLSLERVDQVDVVLHGLVGRLALEAIPRVPLGPSDEIHSARAFGVDIAGRRLLVGRVTIVVEVVEAVNEMSHFYSKSQSFEHFSLPH